jgi:hypothetical protein
MELMALGLLLIIVGIFPELRIAEMPWTPERLRKWRFAMVLWIIFLFYVIAM